MVRKVAIVFFFALLWALIIDAAPSPHKRAEDAASAAALKNSYDEYNAKYFGGRLTHEVRITYGKLPPFYIGFTGQDQWGYHIAISKKYDLAARAAKTTLLHEMCHIATADSKDEDSHGPDWHKCMRNLSDQGAFDDLW